MVNIEIVINQHGWTESVSCLLISDKPARLNGTTMTPLRCYENDLFLKFLYTRRAGMNRHGTTEDYTVAPQSDGTRKSVLVAPLCGATHYSALCAIFG